MRRSNSSRAEPRPPGRRRRPERCSRRGRRCGRGHCQRDAPTAHVLFQQPVLSLGGLVCVCPGPPRPATAFLFSSSVQCSSAEGPLLEQEPEPFRVRLREQQQQRSVAQQLRRHGHRLRLRHGHGRRNGRRSVLARQATRVQPPLKIIKSERKMSAFIHPESRIQIGEGSYLN